MFAIKCFLNRLLPQFQKILDQFVRELVREHVLVREREQNTNKNFVAFLEQEQNKNKKYLEHREREQNKNQKNMRVLSSLPQGPRFFPFHTSKILGSNMIKW